MSEHSNSEHVLPVGLYWAIWAILIVLTFFTAWVATVDLGWMNPVVALVIASFKALVVVLYFMHVRFANRLTWVFSGAAFFWLGIMIVLSMSDYVTRSWLPVPGK